ncbi:MAG: retropepsin-like aspartic protease [Gammaproteobacteria bacterium]
MIKILFLAATLVSITTITRAAEFDSTIPMQEKGAATFYVPTQVSGLQTTEFMVDTGSGYTTINEETLASLQLQDNAVYVKKLQGILANGERIVVPVYLIRQLTIGGQCELHDIEVAVFPGKTRQILGLSTLRKTAPFIFSMDPPQLILSHCSDRKTVNIENSAGQKNALSVY